MKKKLPFINRLGKFKKYALTFIISSTAVITYMHYSTLPIVHNLHNILAELYYLPLLLSALTFGFKGAVYGFIFVTVLYLPYIAINWSGTVLFIANKLIHAVFSGSLAMLAGALVDREARNRQKLEKERYLGRLGQAAAAIVHDLKNPIITIAGFSRRIHEEKGDVKEQAKLISDSAEKMRTIVGEVLDFAKPIKLDLSQKDFRTVISNVCRSCEPVAEEKEVTLSVNLPDDAILNTMDSIKIERALTNLVNNAIEASPIGNVVAITADQKNEFITVRIKDNGEGMDQETLDNIFIPFYTNKNSGTGLGMAIAKKIIEGHQGRLHIDSLAQNGTEISVELPSSVS